MKFARPVLPFVILATAFLQAEKPRLLVLTDIGGDPDDTQSLVRLLVHSNEFQIEGLIASASGTPGELKEKITQPQRILEVLDAFEKVRPNLTKHAEGFPQGDELRAVVKSGNPERGKGAIGREHDTEGSAWIIQAADRESDRPLDITIWGGQTDFLQALWRVREDRGDKGLAEFAKKIRIYDIADQDKVYDRIEKFPGLFYLLDAAPPGKDPRSAVFRGMYLTGDLELTSLTWLDGNIRQNHGPLGALYPPKTHTAPSPQSAMKEGDTPSWLGLFPNGLNDRAHPDWGGWGGLLKKQENGHYAFPGKLTGSADPRETVSRWRPAFQNEFAARMDWCVAEKFEDANHPPSALLNGDKTSKAMQLDAKPGTALDFTAEGSSDPDKNELTPTWSLDADASDLAGASLSSVNGLQTSVRIPEDANPGTLHLILTLTDSGTPPLTRYRRAAITIKR